MGAFDKFRKANKLFWDSSKRKIDKIPDTYTNRKSQYIEVLNRYYTEYTIDIFDEENINRLFEFYPLVPNGITTHSQVYNDLKEIQRNSEDYVIDYVSYKERLKAYYDIHGKDTEWLVKIFAERYDLDRFNITTKEVLDDLHEIIGTVTEPSSLKNNSNATITSKEDKSKTADTKSSVNSKRNTVSYSKQPTVSEKQSCEHKNLSRAIYNYNCGNSDTVAIQKELWALWRYNHVVYVPSYKEHKPPFDLAILPTSSGGQAYAFFTESEFLSTERGESIIEMPFQDLLNKVYNSHGVVNALLINPSLDGYYSAEYSIGLTADILKQICRGSVLI